MIAILGAGFLTWVSSGHADGSGDAPAKPGASGAKDSDGQRVGTRSKEYPWVLLEAGRGRQSLVIRYERPSCALRERVVVRESRSTISIRVVGEGIADPEGEGIACTADLSTPTHTVRLKRPIEGRRIEGPGAWSGHFGMGYLTKSVPDAPHPDLALPGTPRLLGLAPHDAERLLELHGFASEVIGHGRQVVSQDPRRGRVPADSRARISAFSGTVRVVTGS
jgi:hypothetical protein